MHHTRIMGLVSHNYPSEMRKRNSYKTYAYFIGEERKLMAVAQEAGDEVTAAMLSNYLREQEKMVWMLVAYNSGSCKK